MIACYGGENERQKKMWYSMYVKCWWFLLCCASISILLFIVLCLSLLNLTHQIFILTLTYSSFPW